MTPSLLWPVRTVCATGSIYQQRSSRRSSRRDTKVLLKVLFGVVLGGPEKVGVLRPWRLLCAHEHTTAVKSVLDCVLAPADLR